MTLFHRTLKIVKRLRYSNLFVPLFYQKTIFWLLESYPKDIVGNNLNNKNSEKIYIANH